MQGRNLIVTGAFGALGRTVVARARAAGWRVAALDHADAAPEGFAADAIQGGVDLTDPMRAAAAVEGAVSILGGADALVNIAGGFVWEPVDGASNDSWDRMHRMNLLTALNTTRSALPALVASGSGRVVNIGANGAVSAGMGMGAYAASKAGVHRLTEALAEEFKGKVTVNAVLPSIIDTPANRKDMPDADPSKWVTTDELASVILFLASAEAGGVTGALIPVVGRV